MALRQQIQRIVLSTNRNLVLALANKDEARQLLQENVERRLEGKDMIFLDMVELEYDSPCSTLSCQLNIQQIIFKMKRFAQIVLEKMDAHQANTTVICQSTGDQDIILETTLLWGAFAILVEKWELHAVAHAFPDFTHRPVTLPGLDLDRSKYPVTVLDCWQALVHARERGWMDWSASPDDDAQPLLIDELIHYAAPANGAVHILAPGKLLLFPSPVDLPDGELWARGVARPDGAAPARRFAAAFYADLLPDLDVRAVASLDRCRCAAAPAAFAAAGLTAVDLAPDGPRRRPSPLRALDALLTLTRTARGAVALHAGGAGGAGAWPDHTALVVAAYLVGREGFGERGAYAWLLLVCPWLLAAAPQQQPAAAAPSE
jgi:hypothetical protein